MKTSLHQKRKRIQLEKHLNSPLPTFAMLSLHRPIVIIQDKTFTVNILLDTDNNDTTAVELEKGL